MSIVTSVCFQITCTRINIRSNIIIVIRRRRQLRLPLTKKIKSKINKQVQHCQCKIYLLERFSMLLVIITDASKWQ